MTDTTGLFEHTPILAFGKTREHTDLTAADGTRTMAFNNSANTIVAGEHVFTSESTDADIQYMGTCQTTSAAGITTQYPIQNAVGAGVGKIWVATTSVDFQYQVGRGSEQETYSTGTALFVSKGNVAYPVQSADGFTTITLGFNPGHPADYAELVAFIATSRSAGTKTCSLGFWHVPEELSKTIEVYAYPATLSMTHVSAQIVSFSLQFFVVTDDTYVAS